MGIKDRDKPNCCEKGDEYIRWFVNVHITDANHKKFTGWGMMVEAYWYLDGVEEGYHPINFCPFCGKRLEN